MRSQSCSWCHAVNPAGARYCRTCAHRADRPRLDCDCKNCRLRDHTPIRDHTGPEEERRGDD